MAMIHLSGRRILLLAALLLAVFLWRPWQASETSSSRRALSPAASSASPDSPESLVAAGPGRKSRPAEKTAAEAKLRSLLEIREGEISLLRLPPAALERLLKSVPPDRPLALSIDAETPSVVGIYRPESLVGSLMTAAREGMPVEGRIVQCNNSLLSWSRDRWSVDLTPLRGSASMVLQLSMKEGPGELVTTFDVDFGSIVLLRSTEPEAEGLLMVIGKDGGARPPSSSDQAIRESP